jgi:adenylate kinase family enzyme
MTKQTLLKMKIDLYNIIANFSMGDYKQANHKNGKKISKKNKPYTLSQETLKANCYYKMVYGKMAKDMMF